MELSRRAPHTTTAPRRYAGQSLTEFTLVAAIVAILAIPGIAVLRDAQAGMFNAHASTLNSGSMYTAPANADACKDKGWETFYVEGGRFKNQGDCVSWVVTGGKNPPGDD